MTPEQLKKIHQQAESTLRELMALLNATPHLKVEIKPLMLAAEILPTFQALADENPVVAEQLLRLSLATLVNYHTLAEVAAQLAMGDN